MKIVVDTNIIFSALLNSNSTIGDLIFNSEKKFEFYSCNYMKFEIKKHWQKLIKISKLTDEELNTSYHQILSKILFINEEIINEEIWIDAEKIVNSIDIDDIDFVALTKFLKATLWTGDKLLYSGLKQKGLKKVINTEGLLFVRNKTNWKK